MINIFTCGVYGSSEKEFFNKLLENKIDTFCDIRRRRAVRGSEYTFVNSEKLQMKLKKIGISYFHFLEFSPSLELMNIQKEMDIKSKINRRKRESLSEEFIKRFNEEKLKNFDSDKFINTLGKNAKNILFFCVEKNPEACHRSIVADKLSHSLKAVVVHL